MIGICSISKIQSEPVSILDPKSEFQAGVTSIWSPLFQASWDHLNHLHKGRPIRVDPPNPLIEMLNTYHWDEESVFPIGCYEVYGGPATRIFHAEIEKRVEERFQISIPKLRNPS